MGVFLVRVIVVVFAKEETLVDSGWVPACLVYARVWWGGGGVEETALTGGTPIGR